MSSDLSPKKILTNIDPDRAISLAKEEGGFTINPRTGNVLDSGVMVSIKGHEQRHLLNSVGHKQFADYINSPDTLIALTKVGSNLGGWVSTRIDETQTPAAQKELVLDVSRRFNPTEFGRRQARRNAYRNQQEAIYDIASNKTEINPLHPTRPAPGLELVPGTAESFLSGTGPIGEPYFAEVVDPSKIGGPKKRKPAKGQQSIVY